MKHVVVNGVLVLDDGKFTGKRPGRVLRGPGYRTETAPHNVATGKLDARMDAFDRAMREVLAEHRIPGAALAVTDGGRLVFARGYGYADIAEKQPVQPTSLFRIASISKPITAVAILQLVEQKKLSLEDKVCEVLNFDAKRNGDAKFDERLREITIRHLLEHRGGWDRDRSFDAMFQSVRFAKECGTACPAGPAEVIRAMLGQKLDFDPGERYSYSNYGYCLLGRVIEERSGQPYEAYVKEKVLAPLDIRDMRIGCTLAEGRQPNEVRYYDPGRGPSVFEVEPGRNRALGVWRLASGGDGRARRVDRVRGGPGAVRLRV